MGAHWKQLAGQKIVQRHLQLTKYIQLSSGAGFENSFCDQESLYSCFNIFAYSSFPLPSRD
jgi:hypothetical protein